ncbi:MAG TPA: peptidylprolyl isomerase [Verrucomicrobiae bacterium]|jgi:foldase protein PrsA|nr:peptidylprolyl isomerase [Verrucomicrobiae bacterium]
MAVDRRQFQQSLKALNMKFRIFFPAVAAVVLCGLAGALADDTNAVIARGTGIEIKRSDLDDAMAAYKTQIQTLTPAQVLHFQRETLTNLINSKLLLAKATDEDKAAGKKTADLQITAAIENVGSQDAFDQLLKTNGLTEAVVRAKRTDAATAEAVIQRELKVTVTDDEVKKYYDTHTADYEQPEMVRISHILIFTVDPMTRATLPAAQLDVRRKLSENIVKAARSGADFSTLAKQVSEDFGSKSSGGELLPFPRGQMLREIEDAAFSMTNNQVSDVITTSVGYQIIKLLDKIPAKKTSYLTAVADIRQGLTRQKFAQIAPPYLDGLQKAAGVEILDPSLKGTNAAPPGM